jgi:CheY-like chemotaxis protein
MTGKKPTKAAPPVKAKTPSKSAKSAKAEKTARKNPLVLIVDDVPDNRAIYADFLRFCGYDVLEANDGFSAVEMTKQKLPDVVLMDLSLPGMDGWEATRRIKSDETTQHVKIIAVTGHALEGTAKGAREAGCDAFLSKPCLPETLEAEVKRMLTNKNSSRTRTV